MTRRSTALVVGAVGLVAAALGTARTWLRPAIADREGQAAELIAQGDSVTLGALAHQRCRGEGDGKERCYEDFFSALADEGHVRLALGALTALARRDGDIEGDGHVYTHVIGIKAWKPERDVGEVFASCTVLFQSGCYHGVIQAYLTAQPAVDSATVAGLCDQIAGTGQNWWLRFQCVHGLGHGLEMIWNWELPRALHGCDWLTSGWDREGCYGGVFMENAVVSLPTHATARVIAGPAAGGGEPGGHGSHGPDRSRITFKLVDSSDVLYPCSVVAHRYQTTCFMLQGGIIARLVDLDYGRATAECDRVPADLRTFCYLSLGTYAAGLTVLDARKAIRLCQHGDPAFQPWCFVGLAKNFVDVTGLPRDGLEFCRQVPAGRNRRQCFVAVGEQLVILHPADLDARRRGCALSATPRDEADCQYGANLLAQPPEGLPIRPDDPPADSRAPGSG
jgi:hypothetical protein